jgi:sugar O-acyltransferase (sialic acid O-acetyltransferase NeuD family)
MPKLILVGGGGHAKSVIDVVENQGVYQINGIVDKPEKVNKTVLNYPIIAADSQLESLVREDQYFLLTIGQVATAQLRIKLYEQIIGLSGKFATIISPLAHVSTHARVGPGTVVLHHALVNAAATVGPNVIINSQALVEHDAVVGAHCHIATGAIVNGDVTIGDGVLIGSHATVKQGVSIASNTIIGAHAYVHQDIKRSGVYVGVPARPINQEL